MTAKEAAAKISRVVVLVHHDHMPVVMTDLFMTDQWLDDWKRVCIDTNGVCLYDGPPKGDVR